MEPLFNVGDKVYILNGSHVEYDPECPRKKIYLDLSGLSGIVEDFHYQTSFIEYVVSTELYGRKISWCFREDELMTDDVCIKLLTEFTNLCRIQLLDSCNPNNFSEGSVYGAIEYAIEKLKEAKK